MPSLSTSLCMVSGPGALALLRNLTDLRVDIFNKLVLIPYVNVCSQYRSVFRPIRQRVALYRRLSWRLCLRSAVLDSSADPSG